MGSISLFLSAGDPSGDNAAARLVGELSDILPGLNICGLGGEKLRSLGQEQLADGDELAVLGFWEVARRALFFHRLLNRCAEEIRRRRPAAVILVDYPGFNLRLAKKIKPLGIPIIYYISPQVWAWGKGRIADIRELVDLMLVILPFEPEFYQRHGVDARFVGHYLLEDIPASYIGSPLPPKGTLCLLPGSRKQEIARMLPPMLDTAHRFNQLHGTRTVIAAIKNRFNYDTLMHRYSSGDIGVSYEDSRRIIHDSSLVLTASGTATLETAIIGRPMVVVYKTGFITYQIARRLVKLDSIALVNLVLGEKVVPELIQSRVCPKHILPELTRFVQESDYAPQVKANLDRTSELLGGTGASQRAARLIAEHIL
ncbi:MAG: lipid-A-disaccharide synthase [bacterium]